MKSTTRDRRTVGNGAINGLMRRYSTATVLLHHAVAVRLGLGPSDHKCLDLLLERGPMTGSELAALTGLTTGAISGVISRLEAAGHLTREIDGHDARKQILHVSPESVDAITALFQSLGTATATAGVLDGFDRSELSTIEKFLTRAIDYNYRRTAALRVDGTLLPAGRDSITSGGRR